MVEVLTVLVVVSVLAVVALPRMAAYGAQSGPLWRDQVVATLRQAHTIAHGHRRLVCVAVSSNALTLTIASTNPGSACDSAYPGPDGDARWAWNPQAPTTTGSPATLYFQPDGHVSSDGAGATASGGSIAISGESSVTINGETGHVE